MLPYSTRFQGSKRRVLPWLLESIRAHCAPPGRALDAFSGSGVCAWGLAKEGWSVTACDRLQSSYWTVKGFLLSKEAVSDSLRDWVLGQAKQGHGDKAVFGAYQGRFYPDDELAWLDSASAAIGEVKESERGLLYWALFQAALAKRPYNLFHRSNLAMRTREVARSFGNKTTWERPFEELFVRFLHEANAKRFVAPRGTRALVVDPLDAKGEYDLVYLDPPYVSEQGAATPYNDYYSFLDVLCVRDLAQGLDLTKKHRPVLRAASEWESARTIEGAFAKLLARHQSSVMAISYRGDGWPSVEALVAMLKNYKARVVVYVTPVRYALSRGKSQESLIVGEG